jgi:hypothetical protein
MTRQKAADSRIVEEVQRIPRALINHHHIGPPALQFRYFGEAEIRHLDHFRRCLHKSKIGIAKGVGHGEFSGDQSASR